MRDGFLLNVSHPTTSHTHHYQNTSKNMENSDISGSWSGIDKGEVAKKDGESLCRDAQDLFSLLESV